jgi:hypothetical protein
MFFLVRSRMGDGSRRTRGAAHARGSWRSELMNNGTRTAVFPGAGLQGQAEEAGAGCSHPDATGTAVRLLGSGYDAGLARSRRFPKCLSILAVRLTRYVVSTENGRIIRDYIFMLMRGTRPGWDTVGEFPTSLCKRPQAPFSGNYGMPLVR